MKNFIREWVPFTIGIYLAVSLFIWFMRWLPMDCEKRYVDYVFPLSKLHCKVGQ